MNIGSLFLSLGVKDTGSAKKELTTIKGGMGDVASSSLKAKAAIIAALYAFQRMSSSTAQAGTNLENFTATIGVSARTLQQYQYAAQQVGVSNESMESTFRTLQDTMAQTLLKGKPPTGLGRFARLMGDVSPKDIEEYMKAPEKLIQRLQEYAAKETNAAYRNDVLKSFGLGEDVIAALTRQAFKPNILNNAPTYSEKDIKALDRVNAQWKNLGQTIEMAFARFNAKYGGELIGDLTKIVDKVVKLAEAFVKLADSMKLVEFFGKSIEGWTMIFDLLTASIYKFKDAISGRKEGESIKEAEAAPLTPQQEKIQILANEKAFKESLAILATQRLPEIFKKFIEDVKDIGLEIAEPPPGRREPNTALPPAGDIAKPKIPPQSMLAPSSGVDNSKVENNFQLNQTLNFASDTSQDPQKTKDAVKDAVQVAFRQLSAQIQGA